DGSLVLRLAVPTRRSSDLVGPLRGVRVTAGLKEIWQFAGERAGIHGDRLFAHQQTIADEVMYNVRTVREALRIAVQTGLLIRHTDRKSTRLNSSHVSMSYA